MELYSWNLWGYVVYGFCDGHNRIHFLFCERVL